MAGRRALIAFALLGLVALASAGHGKGKRHPGGKKHIGRDKEMKKQEAKGDPDDPMTEYRSKFTERCSTKDLPEKVSAWMGAADEREEGGVCGGRPASHQRPPRPAMAPRPFPCTRKLGAAAPLAQHLLLPASLSRPGTISRPKLLWISRATRRCCAWATAVCSSRRGGGGHARRFEPTLCLPGCPEARQPGARDGTSHQPAAPGSASQEIVNVDVYWHTIMSSSGTGNITAAQIQNQINVLNAAYTSTAFKLVFTVRSIDMWVPALFHEQNSIAGPAPCCAPLALTYHPDARISVHT